MDCKFIVREEDFVGSESGNNSTEGVAADLKLIHGVAGNLELIV